MTIQELIDALQALQHPEYRILLVGGDGQGFEDCDKPLVWRFCFHDDALYSCSGGRHELAWRDEPGTLAVFLGFEEHFPII